MHLIYYTKNVADLHSLSTAVSVAILVGAGYGILRLAFDFIGWLTKEKWSWR